MWEVSVGVRGVLVWGRTGISSPSIICGVTVMVSRGDVDRGLQRMSESACSDSRSSSRNRSRFSYSCDISGSSQVPQLLAEGSQVP